MTPNAKRRLPSLPMVMERDYEVPRMMQNESGEYYEEISPDSAAVVNGNKSSLPRKYSRTPCLKKNVGGGFCDSELLKRSPILSPVNSSPSPILTNSSPPPLHASANLVDSATAELQKQLSISNRQDMYDDGEAYEEVQFTTEVRI